MNELPINRIVTGDCLTVMGQWPENCIDSIVTDPPYGLKFCGASWDHQVPGVPYWEAALRVAKPGATLLAFGGTRTYHRLVCAIEDAGWIVRECIMWIHSEGYPKGANISKKMDQMVGAERQVVGMAHNRADNVNAKVFNKDSCGWKQHYDITEAASEEAKAWDGWGTGLKPAVELICVAMKPLDGTFAENALKWGVSGLWIDGARVPTDWKADRGASWLRSGKDAKGREEHDFVWPNKSGSACGDRVSVLGRWPANVIHDGSEEVVDAFPKDLGSRGNRGPTKHGRNRRGNFLKGMNKRESSVYPHLDKDNGGSAARFFYCAKEKNDNRDGNLHPTVKPLILMKYLCKLTRTPTGGIVLDPFCGSGTTCLAAIREGRDYIGIELEEQWATVARARCAKAETSPLFGDAPDVREASDMFSVADDEE